MSFPVVEARALYKTYLRGAHPVTALRGVSLSVAPGELLTVMGPSGSGKSTLLQLLGGLDRPTAGSILFEDKDLSSLDDAAMARFRRRRLGFVFQFFHLLPRLTAVDNVLLPLTLDGRADAAARDRACLLLGRLGLADRIHHRSYELSGGEMQRVALARAVVSEPALILADEPTGNLDSRAGARVLDLLEQLVDEEHVACVMVTHDPRAARHGTRTVILGDGEIVSDGPVRTDDSGTELSGGRRAVA